MKSYKDIQAAIVAGCSVVGFIGGVVTRPTIPISGQPPVDVAFGALFSSFAGKAAQMDQRYAEAFLGSLLLWTAGGMILGGRPEFFR